MFMCLDYVFMFFAVLRFLQLLVGSAMIFFFFFFPPDLFMFTVRTVYLPLSCCSNYFNQTSESLKVECCQHDVWKSNILNAKITAGISRGLTVTFIEECSEILIMNFRYTRNI